MALTFHWDPDKAAANLSKHGVSFEEAASSFGDPMALTIADPDHSNAEDRFLHLAVSARNRPIVTVFVERVDWIRIISSRPASKAERQQYEQRLPRH